MNLEKWKQLKRLTSSLDEEELRILKVFIRFEEWRRDANKRNSDDTSQKAISKDSEIKSEKS
jgi:hypothetical protein